MRSSKVLFLSLFLVFCVALRSEGTELSDASQMPVKIFAGTDSQDPVSRGALRLGGELPLHHTRAFLAEILGALPKDPPKLIPFYFASGRSPEFMVESLSEARAQLRGIYPNYEPAFDVLQKGRDTRELKTLLRTQMKTLSEEAPEVDRVRIEKAMEKIADEALVETERAFPQLFERSRIREAFHPSPDKVDTIVKVFSFLRAGLTGFLRIKQTTEQMSPTLASFAAAIGLNENMVWDYYKTRYQIAMGEFLLKSGIPLETRSKLIQRINEMINGGGEWAKAKEGDSRAKKFGKTFVREVIPSAKATLLNVGIHAVGVPFANQWLNDEYLADGKTTDYAAEAGDNFRNGAKGSIAFQMGFRGAKILREKGQVTGPEVELYFKTLGIFDGAGDYIGSKPELKASHRPWATWPAWSTHGLMLGVALMAPVKNNRIAFVDRALRDEKFVGQMEPATTLTSLSLHDGSLERELRRVDGLPKLKGRRRHRQECNLTYLDDKNRTER